MKLEINYQITEFLLAIFFCSQSFLTFSIPNVILIFTLLIILKYVLEGYRLQTLFLIITQVLILLFPIFIFKLLISALNFFLIHYFPIYKIPSRTGKYKVGYIKHFSRHLRIAIFYPTSEKTNDIYYYPHEEHWQRFYEIMKLSEVITQGKSVYPFPKILHKIFLSSFEKQKLNVNENAKIVYNPQGFPIIIFSHGLSANRLLYTSLLGEWASHGFIVFSVEHDEKVLVRTKRLSDYVNIRKEQLQERIRYINETIEIVSNLEEMKKIFKHNDLTLKYNKLFLAGHSFGGATAMEVAYSNNKVTGGIILLDPWFIPIKEDLYKKKIHLPIINIRSHEFHRNDELSKLCELYNQKYMEKDDFISGYFNDSVHNCMTDVVLVIPRELYLFGLINRLDDIEEHLHYHLNISTLFLQAINSEQKNVKSYILKEMDESLMKKGRTLDTFKLDS